MWRRILFTVLALTAALPASAGVANTYARNRVHLFVDAYSEFSGGGASLVDAPPSDNRIADDPDVDYLATASTAILPSTGAAKDGASGSAALTARLQSGLADDLFDFDFHGTASASEAFMASGAEASARVELVGTVSFYLDYAGTGMPPGIVLGTLTLDAVRAADPYEDFWVQVSTLGHGVIRTILPGSAATTLALTSGDMYTIDLIYRMNVPHGVDPDFSLQWGVGASFAQPVPEPSTWALATAGLLMLGVVARRRRA